VGSQEKIIFNEEWPQGMAFVHLLLDFSSVDIDWNLRKWVCGICSSIFIIARIRLQIWTRPARCLWWWHAWCLSLVRGFSDDYKHER